MLNSQVIVGIQHFVPFTYYISVVLLDASWCASCHDVFVRKNITFTAPTTRQAALTFSPISASDMFGYRDGTAEPTMHGATTEDRCMHLPGRMTPAGFHFHAFARPAGNFSATPRAGDRQFVSHSARPPPRRATPPRTYVPARMMPAGTVHAFLRTVAFVVLPTNVPSLLCRVDCSPFAWRYFSSQ